MNELIIDQQSAAALLIDCGTVDTCSWTPPANMTFQQWTEIGRKFQQVDTSINWWLGDWLNEGEKRYGETYTQAIEVTGHAIERLKQAKGICARIKKDMRISFLTWTHHVQVAYLEDQEARQQLLSSAVQYELSTRELAEEVKNYKDNLNPKPRQEEPPPPPAEPEDLTYRSTNHRELATIQAAMDTVQRQRWPTTVGATGLPPVMRPHEHEALSTYANVTADMSKWLVGDHGLQVEREIDHLARLYKWKPEKRLDNMLSKLSDAAAQHRMALPKFEQHMETARMFGADMRRQSATVGYEHHYILRNRSRAEAVEYLDRAEREGWTVQRLEAELHPQQPNEIAIFGSIRECVDITIEGNTITLTSTYGKLIITQWRIE